MPTRNIGGNVPEPDELYGREEFIAHLWRQIKGNNILLLAPRRFGKTGIMRHVLMRPLPGYLPVYLELALQLSNSDYLAGDDTSCRVLEVWPPTSGLPRGTSSTTSRS